METMRLEEKRKYALPVATKLARVRRFIARKKKHFVVILGFLTSENGGIKTPCNKQVIRISDIGVKI